MTNEHIDRKIDATIIHGCVMPIIAAKKELATMNSGEVLEIITKQGLNNDFKVWTKQQNHELLHFHEEEKKVIYYIKKG